MHCAYFLRGKGCVLQIIVTQFIIQCQFRKYSVQDLVNVKQYLKNIKDSLSSSFLLENKFFFVLKKKKKWHKPTFKLFTYPTTKLFKVKETFFFFLSKGIEKVSNYILLVHTQLFINNEFVPGRGPLIDTINPANEKVLCKVHSADESDVNLAVEAAYHCHSKTWRKVAPADRGRLLNKLADLMERDKDILATLDAVDNGKSFVVARDVDVTDSINCYRYFAGWADKIHGKTIDTTFDKLCYTLHESLGVVGAVIPWNYPTMMAAWKFAPALAAGNCSKCFFF